jgi:hypothetical protein
VPLADLTAADVMPLGCSKGCHVTPAFPRCSRRQHTGAVIHKQACQALGSMEPTKGNIAIVADSSPAKTTATATEILAAALSELLNEAKRHTALLEALVECPARASTLSPVAGTAALPRKTATSPAVAAPVSARSHKAANGSNTNSSSHACFSVEELRARARAHNHLLDIDSPKSRAILALLRDDGTVPDHFPVRQLIHVLLLHMTAEYVMLYLHDILRCS